MSRRSVLVVAWWYPGADNPVRGVFVRAHALAAARDHDVTVLALEPAHDLGRAPYALAAAAEDGLRTVRVRYAPLPGYAAAAAYVPGVLAAARRLPRPDVVHAHVYMGGLLAAPLARHWHVPLVLSEHFSGFQLGTLGAPGRIAARGAFRAADTICPVSESLRRALAPLAPGARFRVVPNPVDTQRFHPPASRAGADRMLFVGNLDPVKGVATAIEAAALVRARRPGATLELIGTGPQEPWRELARRVGAPTTFHGAIATPAVAAAMRAADVLLAPSRTETFGVAVAEALACGLPVVASDTGALPERVDASSGVLVPPGDPQALAAAAERVLDGRDGFDPQAVAAAARERYSPDAVADAWSEVYAAATARGRRGT